jgi:hypothetical protein
VAQTDNPSLQKTVDHPAAQAKPTDSAQSALQKHATDLRQEAKKPTDAAPKTTDAIDVSKVTDRLKLAVKPEDLKIVAQEQSMNESRRQLQDQIKKPGADAKVVQAAQDNFKKQVSDAISASNDLSKGAADSRPIDRINSSLAATERHQADLEKTLKLSPSNQPASIKAMLKKDSSSLTPTEKDYVETLTMKETLMRAKESASVANATYGSAVAQGLIGDLSHRDSNGMATPSTAEVAQAFTSMGIAHRLNGESREPGGFQDDYTKIVSKYAEQLTATGKMTLNELTNASSQWHKNPAGAESLLRSANYTVDSLNIPQIQEQLNANKDNPAISQQLTNVLKVANSARVEYASFLYENGRLGESKARLTQAQAETPAQCASDPSYAQLTDKTTLKKNQIESSIEGWQTQYTQSMGNSDWVTAENAAKHLQDETTARMKQQDMGKALLDQQQTQLQKELATAKTQAEKDTITAQINTVNEQSGQFAAQKAIDTKGLALLSYQQGFLHMSEKKMAEANEDFKKVSELDPATAKSLNDNPPTGLPKLDDLIKQSKEPSWWQNHWRLISGVGIGIAATAAVIATGGAALPAVGIILAGGALYTGAGATAGETSTKQLEVNFGVGCATTALSVVLKAVPMKFATAIIPGAGAEVANVATATLAKEGLEVAAKQGLNTAVSETGKAALTETTTTALAETGKTVVANQAAIETGKVVAANATTDLATETVKQQAGKTIAESAAQWGGKVWTNFKALPSNVVQAGKDLPANTMQLGKDVFSTNTLKSFVGYNTIKQIAAARSVDALKAVAVPTLKTASTELGVGATGLGAYESYRMARGETADQIKSHLGRDAAFAFLAVRGGAALSDAAPALSFVNKVVEGSGIGVPTTVGGYAFAAVPEIQNYYNKNETYDQAVQNTLTNGVFTSMAFGMTNQALGKYMTPDKLFPAGSFSTSGLVASSIRSSIPYALQEVPFDLITAANSQPLDPTDHKDNLEITDSYVNQNGFQASVTTAPPSEGSTLIIDPRTIADPTFKPNQ